MQLAVKLNKLTLCLSHHTAFSNDLAAAAAWWLRPSD